MWVWQADIDNSGTIDYGEFLAATVHLNKLEREENLVSAFCFFDKDGSGYITIDELQQACKDFGLSEVHLDDMIKEIDQDNVSKNSYVDCIYYYYYYYNIKVVYWANSLYTYILCDMCVDTYVHVERGFLYTCVRFCGAGWADRLWGICCNDEEGQWRNWEENHERQF